MDIKSGLYRCEMCKKDYKSYKSHWNHINRFHQQKSDNVELLLNNVEKISENVEKMLNNVESDIQQLVNKSLICDICNKKFNTRSAKSHHKKNVKVN